MILILFIYFLAGVLQDFLFTVNLRYVNKNKIFMAVFTSFLTVTVSMIALYNIITQLNPANGYPAIVVYCLGIATGTYLAMKFKISSK